MEKKGMIVIMMVLIVALSGCMGSGIDGGRRGSNNDADGDGTPDEQDAFPADPYEWVDYDGDGVGDNSDAFYDDPDEWEDSDGDGVGDNEDIFPNNPKETVDSDDDGVGDNSDPFPDDDDEWEDTDGDGVGDNTDAFPNDGGETVDSDDDGVGDNGDPFPNDPSENKDSDGDGVGDNTDEYPFDGSESKDSDGDGVGDNGDHFPDDPYEWSDSDGDGMGDNSDPYPNDPSNGAEDEGLRQGMFDERDGWINSPEASETPDDQSTDQIYQISRSTIVSVTFTVTLKDSDQLHSETDEGSDPDKGRVTVSDSWGLYQQIVEIQTDDTHKFKFEFDQYYLPQEWSVYIEGISFGGEKESYAYRPGLVVSQSNMVYIDQGLAWNIEAEYWYMG